MLPVRFFGGREREEGLAGREEVLVRGLQGMGAGWIGWRWRRGGGLGECNGCPAEGGEGVLVVGEDEGDGGGDEGWAGILRGLSMLCRC